MKASIWTLFILQTLLLLSTATFDPDWEVCDSNHTQFDPYYVMVTQMDAFPQVLMISACGSPTPDHDYIAFNHLEVNGSIAMGSDAYTWDARVPYHFNVTAGGQFCLDYSMYLPDIKAKEVNLRIVALDDEGSGVGCVDLMLKNEGTTMISA